MIFQKPPAEIALDKNEEIEVKEPPKEDNVDTVVGPSVNVEGDFASEGNIVIKGSVAGSVHTSKHLLVEEGAKIAANVNAGSATISGIIKGNVKVSESLVLTNTARVLGDIKVSVLQVEAGALLSGKVSMGVPSDLGEEEKTKTSFRRRREKKEEESGE